MKSSICLVCPKSCLLNPLESDATTGQKLCPRGLEFFEQESTAPLRPFFSTYRDEEGNLVPYRISAPIPIDEIKSFLARLKKATSEAERNVLHQEFYKRSLGKT